MDKEICKNCQYYIQHFAMDQRKIYRVCCGHCTFSHPKRKRPDTKACDNFIKGIPPEDAFASKEYLSKELLQYLLHLELLPQIKE